MAGISFKTIPVPVSIYYSYRGSYNDAHDVCAVRERQCMVSDDRLVL